MKFYSEYHLQMRLKGVLNLERNVELEACDADIDGDDNVDAVEAKGSDE